MIVADALARSLGVASFVLAALGTWIALRSYLRDRPRLALTWRVTNDGGSWLFRVTVVNDGRHPVALAEARIQDFAVGRAVRWRIWLRRRVPLLRLFVAFPSWGGSAVVPEDDLAEPKILWPSEHRTFTFRLDYMWALRRGPRYASATDVLGRTVELALPPDVAGAATTLSRGGSPTSSEVASADQ